MGLTKEQPVVLVTGAAGGFGRALVDAFVGGDWNVAAAGHRTCPDARHDQTRVWPCRVDITQRDEVAEVVAGVIRRWGRLDALINNAGVAADAPLAQLDDAAWDRVLDVNLKGAFLCAQAALGPMLDRGSGHIVNVASHAVRLGRRGQSAYAAAKAGLVGLTLSLAREVGSAGICVNAVFPGVLSTRMTAALPAATMEAFARASVLGRINEPSEPAAFVVSLVRTSNISGQVFALDGRILPWC